MKTDKRMPIGRLLKLQVVFTCLLQVAALARRSTMWTPSATTGQVRLLLPIAPTAWASPVVLCIPSASNLLAGLLFARPRLQKFGSTGHSACQRGNHFRKNGRFPCRVGREIGPTGHSACNRGNVLARGGVVIRRNNSTVRRKSGGVCTVRFGQILYICPANEH